MILLNSFIISLTILGFHILIKYLIFHFKELELEDIYDNYPKLRTLFKPLFLCPPCMTSIWGTSLYFLMYGYFDIQCYIFTIGLVGFSNYLGSKYLL